MIFEILCFTLLFQTRHKAVKQLLYTYTIKIKELQMQTQTIKTELLINGQKVVVGHQFLEDIINDIPDIKENSKIFAILALCDNPEVRETLTRKDAISKKTVALLLEDENIDVVDGVLSNRDLAKQIEEEALWKIIKANNIKLLCTIASNIEDYTLCDGCKIAKKLIKHPVTVVRYNLVKWRVSDVISTKLLQKLAHDEDSDVAQEARDELKNRDK